MSEEARAGFSLTVPKSTWHKLVKTAQRKGVSWPEFIERLIEEAVK